MTECLVLPQDGGTYTEPVPFAVFASSPNGTSSSWMIYSAMLSAGNYHGTDANNPTSSDPVYAAAAGGTGYWIGMLTPALPCANSGQCDFDMNVWDGVGSVISSAGGASTSDGYSRAGVTVVANPFPDMSSGTTVANLEVDPNWSLSNGTATGGTGTTGSSALTTLDDTVVSTITGNTLTVTSTGANINTRASDTQASLTGNNVYVDEWVYLPSVNANNAADVATALAGLEFNINMDNGTNLYSVAMKCDGTNWNLWNGTGWVGGATPYPCTTLFGATGKPDFWHHIQLYATTTGGNVVYQTFLVDGLIVYGADPASYAATPLGTSFPAVATTGTAGTTVGVTVDNNASGTANTVSVDWINLTVF